MSLYANNNHYKQTTVFYVKCYLNGNGFYLKSFKALKHNISRYFWTTTEDKAEVFLTLEQATTTLDFITCRRTRKNMNFIIIES